MTILIRMSATSLLASICGASLQPPQIPDDRPVRARYQITVADDFIIDIYHNGRAVPDSKREVIEELYGATAERVNIEVCKGTGSFSMS